MALDLAKKEDADIVLATDPDADRLGVYAKDSKTGEYMAFTGNMSGMLIAEYVLSFFSSALFITAPIFLNPVKTSATSKL